MANHKSAQKRARQTIKKTVVNRARRKKMRTAVKQAELALGKGEATIAKTAVSAAQPALDRAVSKGVMHKKTASRKLSRLNARLKKLATGVAA
jgi:small subunit ribosomal protein S20